MVKARYFPESNYAAIFDGKQTIRLEVEGKMKKPPFPEFYDIAINNLCYGGCSYCFLPETEVVLSDGRTESIDNLSIGDVVSSLNEEHGIVESKAVDQVHKRHINEIIFVIELDNDKTIKVTESHKFLTKNRGWAMAKDLSTEDDLVYIGDMNFLT